ncbi:MAG: helix-turn-helix domain-containing protein [Gammaproteobacteria bacterium]
MNTARTRVADRIRVAMEAKGENPYSLAAKTHIPRVTILRKLDGGAAFNVDELEAIGDALDIAPEELVRKDAA